MKKAELVAYCSNRGIETKKLRKAELLEAIRNFERQEINDAITKGAANVLLEERITHLAQGYARNLGVKIAERKQEMATDNDDHYLIYRVLGVSDSEGRLIDEYQNKGDSYTSMPVLFWRKRRASAFFFANLDGRKRKVPNNLGAKPKTFEIDFLNGNDAVELKWRDATTDGDHITKEHARIRSIESQGYKPIRVMFYEPQREQAKKIQATLATLYNGVGGEYFAGKDAWNYIAAVTGYDLKAILTKIADSC